MKHEVIIPTTKVGVKIFHSRDGVRKGKIHWHNSLEILLCLDGEMIVWDKGEATVLSRNTFKIINSRAPHYVDSNGNEAIVLQIPITLLGNVLLQFEDGLVAAHEDIIDLIKRAYALSQQTSLASQFELKSDIFLLLAKLLDYFYQEEMSDKSNSIAEEVLRYIIDNHHRTISRDSIAKHFQYNPDYLSRKCRESYNCSLTDMIYEVRCKYIYNDLFESNEGILQLYEKHGVTNVPKLLKSFQKLYGASPNQLRKSLNPKHT